MATYILRRGNETVSFTNDASNVTIEDSADNMPYTVTAEEGRTIWTDYIRRGFARDGRSPATAPVVNAAPVQASPARITVPVTASGNGTQRERDVNRTMDSRRNGLARNAWDNGTNGAESKALDMQRVLSKLKDEGGLYLVNYYIPVELSQLTITVRSQRSGRDVTRSAVPNPAASWRGLAIHLDGSNWLMTREALNSDFVQDFFRRMDEYKDFVGGQGESPAYWDTQLRDEEHAKFVAIAERKFMTYIRNLHTSLIECIASADTALRNAMESEEWATKTEKEQNAAEAYRNNRVRSRIKKADEELNDAIRCAERFDMTEELSELFAALRNAISAQREAFNATAESKGIKGA